MQQQLKNAFLKGCLPRISSFVHKQQIDHATGPLSSTMDYAKHAERHLQRKKEQKKDRDKSIESTELTEEMKCFSQGQVEVEEEQEVEEEEEAGTDTQGKVNVGCTGKEAIGQNIAGTRRWRGKERQIQKLISPFQ